MTGHTPHPEVWTNFSAEKSSKDPGLRHRVVWTFVNLSIPANRTNRDVLEQIAKLAEIPIESLCDELDHPAYPKGHVIFGFAGDEIDRIATCYDQMRWWVSDTGLNVAIVNSAKSDATRILDLVTLAADAQFSGSREALFPGVPSNANDTGREDKDLTAMSFSKETLGATTAANARGDRSVGQGKEAREPTMTNPDVRATPVDKGNLAILRGLDGELKRAVSLDVARRFGGVSRRAIEDAASKGALMTEGKRTQRKVLVRSLLDYFPPEN